MFYEVLSNDRRVILLKFKSFKNTFYLAESTALALQLGHRDSVDFDFFSPVSFDGHDLIKQLDQIFDSEITVIQQEKDTLTFIVDNIKVSFFGYQYPLLETLIDTENLKLASVLDIGCMKLSTILGRATTKDYVDLYYILQQIPLKTLLEEAKHKYPSLDIMTVLKSLTYFDDVDSTPLIYKIVNPPTFDQIKNFLADETKKYLD